MSRPIFACHYCDWRGPNLGELLTHPCARVSIERIVIPVIGMVGPARRPRLRRGRPLTRASGKE